MLDQEVLQGLEELLPSWMVQQRWYAGKGRVPALRRIGGLQLQDPAGEVDIDVHLMLDASGQSPTIYQVPLTFRGDRLAGADHALVATVEQGSSGTRYVYDGPHDPVFAAAVLRRMGHPGQLLSSHVLKGEQSNTSIILDLVDARGAPSNPLICKLFRVLHHGDNPDVVVQSALSAAGSPHVPRSVGYIVGEWPDTGAPDGMARGHLACAQEFFPGVEDAWRVALAAVAVDGDFSAQARSLGQTTAEVHATLAHAMTTVTASDEDVAALTRSMRARHASAVSEVPALAAYDSMVHASIEQVSSATWPALQRIHGDYHLGQVLEVPHRGWVLVDFEGEPLRPLTERTRPDLALRDVAGMLRSFDYAAGSWEQTHPGRSAREWADRARIAFLEGYAKESGRDPREDAVLLDALELDKALYEVVYEARNRPAWLTIPTTAIERLLAGRRSDLRL